MDLLTPTVNVPAERAKLRVLRDEIAADAQQRLAHQRKYTARGFLRDMHPLVTEGQPGHGGAPAGTVRPAADLEIPAAAALMHEAQACGAGCGRCSCGVGEQGVSAAEACYLLPTYGVRA